MILVGPASPHSGVHLVARTIPEPLAEYRGRRVAIKDNEVDWNVPCEYTPGSFTSDNVLRDPAADSADLASCSGELRRRAGEPQHTFEQWGFDADGAPLNPRGRTGLRGRGAYFHWGPNLAVDPIVTRTKPITGELQVLAVKRTDTRQWALPGGRLRGQDAKSRLRQMLEKEAVHATPCARDPLDLTWPMWM
jgi:hypothetical protein